MKAYAARAGDRDGDRYQVDTALQTQRRVGQCPPRGPTGPIRPPPARDFDSRVEATAWRRSAGTPDLHPKPFLNDDFLGSGPWTGRLPGRRGPMVRIDFNRLRLLVIDDNAHMRRIIRTLLHGFGARDVYEAEDGAAGLDAFTHYMPDIVLTDWAMPIFDGLELTQMIRQAGRQRQSVRADHHGHRPHREERASPPRATPASPNSSPSRSRPRRSISAIVNVVANPRPVHQDQDLFRAGSAAQHQSQLRRPRAAQGRQGETSSASSRCSTRAKGARLTGVQET